LRDDGDDLNAARRVFERVLCQFTEPASAVWSPGAAVEGEQHRPFIEETLQRSQFSLLRW